jgi:Fe-Mn family superoxide dismutase
MAFELPPLPYEPNALEPSIDAQTMTIHHDKHHNTYVTNLNAAVQGTEFETMELEQLIANLDRVPAEKRTAVRNNGGGHWNHSMFWQIMGPGGGGAPTGEVAQAIDQAFGSFDAMKEAVNKAGAGRFRLRLGLGHRRPGRQAGGHLDPESGQPADDRRRRADRHPDPRRRRLGARLLSEVPEPAADYLAAWWDTVNWDAVNERYRQARG